MRVTIFLLFLGFYFTIPASANGGAIVNPNETYTFPAMEKDLKELVEKYPDLLELHVIGESVYKRPIYAVKMGHGIPTTFVNGAHHAREWMTATLNMYYIEKYAETYYGKQQLGQYNIRQLLQQTSIWFVPMVNPDGVTLQQKGLSAFPKEDHGSLRYMNQGSSDFTRWKANARGVDLNRQYEALWKDVRADPGRPNYMNYKGPSPYSEPEAKAIRDFSYEIDPEVAISYHSAGKIIYWNFLQQGERYKRDRQYADQISQLTGYSLVFPKRIPSGGGYTDWFVSEFKRPAYTPEIGTYPGQRHLPLAAFPTVWKENRLVPAHAAQMAISLHRERLGLLGSPLRLHKGDSVVDTDVSPQLINGRTYVPLRVVTNELKLNLSWDASTQNVKIWNSDVTLDMKVNEKNIFLNSEVKTTDASLLLNKNRVLVPLRVITESFNAPIIWDQKKQTVILP